MTPGLQAAQAVHAATQFFSEWPTMANGWLHESNFLVIVSVPDEPALERMAAEAATEGMAISIVTEPDLGDTVTALAFEPGHAARRICAQLPLALKESVMT